MKLETEGDNAMCLFISAERRNDEGATTGCTTNGSAQVSPASIESADASVENGSGNRGCGAPTVPSAAKHVNGSAERALSEAAGPLGLGSFDCEHFRFIDDDDDAEDVDVIPDTNGTSEAVPTETTPETATEKRNGHQDIEAENRHLSEVSFGDSPPTIPEPPPNGEMCEATVNAMPAPRPLKSVLKKGKSSERKPKRARVTFDEAVTLYTDEFEDIQLLALRSAAEFNCAEVFYMFEPPIEYQDFLLPFEPPAEYRDPENVDPLIDPIMTVIPEADVSAEEVNIPSESMPENNGEEKAVSQDQGPPQCINSEPVEPPDGGEVKDQDQNRDSPLESPATSDSEQQQQQTHRTDPSEESEKLFERFLEAEREFDEDEELNRVFHALENDLENDEKNGTFDDNFFKKLISLLSAVEGDVPLQSGDFFTTTDFTTVTEDALLSKETEEDDQTPSRTLSEADSDCSVSSQDTIIVRLGDEDSDAAKQKLCRQNSETETFGDDSAYGTALDEGHETSSTSVASSEIFDEVFSDEALVELSTHCQRTPKQEFSGDSSDLSRQSSGEQPPLKEGIQDADDSTSSDSRSGEVEEDIKLDDIGYDEEDAEDYDEECLRGMVRGNSKIRRIIKKNALQCPLFRSIEARRRQQSGTTKYPRPKSPPLSQESIVEQLKWLTTVDDKDVDNFASSKPPDVILSTGSVPLNGGMPRCVSSEEDYSNGVYRYPGNYPRQMVGQEAQSGTYHVQLANYPGPHMARQMRPWTAVNTAQVPQQFQRPNYPAPRAVVRPSQIAYPDERMSAASPVPRDYRDWRVIQRGGQGPPPDFKRCPNGTVTAYRKVLPPQNPDELEQFVQQGSQRIERIRKRYSVAEEEEDPTFGFARRPSVRGVQNRLPASNSQYLPSDIQQQDFTMKYMPTYVCMDGSGQVIRPRNPPDMPWGQAANWRQGEPSPIYCASPIPGASRPSGPIPVHRASVALAELSGCATLLHPKAHADTRYHSYAENAYSGGSQTLPHKRWNSVDPRTCMVPANATLPRQVPNHQLPRLQGPPQPTLQVPPHPSMTSDERGVPEGASSSPKVSSDSLYHGPVQEAMPVGGGHKDDSVIYYSMNV